MRRKKIPLQPGDRVAIIGGGPAGSLFAIQLLREARRLRLPLEAAIFDSKSFLHTGGKGCNMCAGAVGEGFLHRLKELGIPLDPAVIQQEVTGYSLSGPGLSAFVKGEHDQKIATVFRGAGPGHCPDVLPPGSFDHFLLRRAQEEGAHVFNWRIDRLEFGLGSEKLCRLCGKSQGQEYTAALVVGAFGVNSAIHRAFTFGYRPPRTWHACQAEIYLPRCPPRRRYSRLIHVFLSGNPQLKLVAFTPKGPYLTATGIGKHVKIADLSREIGGNLAIRCSLPRRWEIVCHCHPQVPVTTGRRPYDDRVVIVGDACISRYLKNGIESAYWTSRYAVEAVLHYGVGRSALRRRYFHRCLSTFAVDNLCGKVFFQIYHFISRRPLLARGFIQAVRREQHLEAGRPRPVSGVLWHLFTGDSPYRKIILLALSPRVVLRFLRGIVRAATGGRGRLRRAAVLPTGNPHGREIRRAGHG